MIDIQQQKLKEGVKKGDKSLIRAKKIQDYLKTFFIIFFIVPPSLSIGFNKYL